jgi:copper(I)-binding protein
MAIAYLIATQSAMAAEYKVGPLLIGDPWSREIADSFQLHAMTMENGIAKMRELNGIEIKPGE